MCHYPLYIFRIKAITFVQERVLVVRKLMRVYTFNIFVIGAGFIYHGSVLSDFNNPVSYSLDKLMIMRGKEQYSLEIYQTIVDGRD